MPATISSEGSCSVARVWTSASSAPIPSSTAIPLWHVVLIQGACQRLKRAGGLLLWGFRRPHEAVIVPRRYPSSVLISPGWGQRIKTGKLYAKSLAPEKVEQNCTLSRQWPEPDESLPFPVRVFPDEMS